MYSADPLDLFHPLSVCVCVCVVLRSDLRQVAVWYLYSSETVTAAACVCTPTPGTRSGDDDDWEKLLNSGFHDCGTTPSPPLPPSIPAPMGRASQMTFYEKLFTSCFIFIS